VGEDGLRLQVEIEEVFDVGNRLFKIIATVGSAGGGCCRQEKELRAEQESHGFRF